MTVSGAGGEGSKHGRGQNCSLLLNWVGRGGGIFHSEPGRRMLARTAPFCVCPGAQSADGAAERRFRPVIELLSERGAWRADANAALMASFPLSNPAYPLLLDAHQGAGDHEGPGRTSAHSAGMDVKNRPGGTRQDAVGCTRCGKERLLNAGR